MSNGKLLRALMLNFSALVRLSGGGVVASGKLGGVLCCLVQQLLLSFSSVAEARALE